MRDERSDALAYFVHVTTQPPSPPRLIHTTRQILIREYGRIIYADMVTRELVSVSIMVHIIYIRKWRVA